MVVVENGEERGSVVGLRVSKIRHYDVELIGREDRHSECLSTRSNLESQTRGVP